MFVNSILKILRAFGELLAEDYPHRHADTSNLNLHCRPGVVSVRRSKLLVKRIRQDVTHLPHLAHRIGDSRIRAGAMFFLIDEQAVGGDSTMWGAQLGYDTQPWSDLKLDLSASYLDYQLGSITGADAGDFRSNLRNAAGGYLSDFNLADLIVGATWSGLGPRWPLRMSGDLVRNLGARTSEDTGYSVDLSVGRLARPGDWRVGYTHAMAETDAVLAAFSHDNIALGSNYDLRGLTLDYVALPGAMLTAIWYHYRPHVAPAAGDAWQDRFRVSLTTTF